MKILVCDDKPVARRANEARDSVARRCRGTRWDRPDKSVEVLLQMRLKGAKRRVDFRR